MQRAYRAHREQLGIARAGADQREAAGFGGGGLVLGSAQQCIEIGWRGFALWIADRKGRERTPKLPPARRRKPRRLHRLAPAASGVGPAGKAARDHRLELGADCLGEDRRRAVGRNSDDERRAIDDGAEGKIAISGPVDHIDRNAGRARGAAEALGLGRFLEAADGDGSAGKILNPPRPLLQRDRCVRRVCRDGAQLLAWLLGKDRDIGARRRQHLRLPCHRRPVAGDQRTFAGKRQEDWQPRQSLHARRMRWRGVVSVLDCGHQYTSC